MKDNQECSFTIYRLCRDDESKNRIILECEKYCFRDNVFLIGYNYFKLLNKIIIECVDDFALVCHNDVILPLNIDDKIKECITKSDLEFGRNSWGIIGNFGIEYLSWKIIRYLGYPDSFIIPYMSIKPSPVVYLDGNSLLLNIKNLRDNNVCLPEHLSCSPFYAFILSVESYKKNLVCAVDSSLYVFLRSSFNQKNINEVTEVSDFRDYWIKQFVNHNVITNTGLINVIGNLDYLRNDTDDNRYDFYDIVHKVLEKIHNQKPRKIIYIITNTQLNRINLLRRLLDTLMMASEFVKDIEFKFFISVNNVLVKNNLSYITILQKEYDEISPQFIINEDSKDHFHWVASLENILLRLEDDDNAFVWIIDDNIFIFPECLKYLNILLNKSHIFVGNSDIFEEKWDESANNSLPLSIKKISTFDTGNYFNVFRGENVVPGSSVIYPLWVLKKVFKNFKRKGDYLEDFPIFLVSQKYISVQHFPMLISGISLYGQNNILEKNNTHWHYTYATYLPKILNNDAVKSWMYDAIQENDRIIQELRDEKRDIQNQLQNAYSQLKAAENQIQAITNTLRWQICERLMLSPPGRLAWSMYMKLKKNKTKLLS